MRRGTRLTTRFIAAACAFPVLAGGSVLTAETPNRAASGALSNDTRIGAMVLTSKNGVSARIIPLSAALQALHAPDRAGNVANRAFFNMAGEGQPGMLAQRTTIAASRYTPVNAALIGRAGWSRSYSPTRPTSPPSARRTSRPASRTVTA